MNTFIYTFNYILDEFLPAIWSFTIGNWVFSLVLLIAIVGTVADVIIANHVEQ